MDKQTAQALMNAIEVMGARLNDVAAVVETISDDSEKKALRRPLGEMMSLTFTDIMLPIIRQYRDLDPDKDTEWYKQLKARNSADTDDSELSGRGDR